jgi:hypothetical protein
MPPHQEGQRDGDTQDKQGTQRTEPETPEFLAHHGQQGVLGLVG